VTAPGRPELQRARQWSVALASALDGVTREVGGLARRLADGWPDAQGQEWLERLLQLRRTLERDVDAAAAWGQAIDRLPDDPSPSASAGVADGTPFGPRLGGTEARRVDDERGVRIPRLNGPVHDAD
jgi:hypothetical protein